VTRLVLVRHAEPQEDARGRCYGSLDIGLSDEGREHAQRLAAALATLDYDAVYTSPRLRAAETAAPLTVAPIVVDDLREIDFGELEGRRYEEIERTHPELYRAWMERPTEVRFPGGESFADLRARTLRAFDAILSTHESSIVVTHGGAIRAGVAAWLGMPDEAIFRLDQSYCGVTIVEWLDGTPIVRLLNAGFASVPA
jgi:alpha-ribazole phosphatase/probable phosphoglycerate mutase